MCDSSEVQLWREDLDAAITAGFEASGATYGSPRITRDLHEHGWRVSVNTVAARMAELGLVARVRRKPRSLTRSGRRPAAPDLVGRQAVNRIDSELAGTQPPLMP
ncbi:IS3 family transposase [Nonomuraea angiospora]|uniref:IS3 family transposase n=1 Tax=Nonomuraea angiospora TaxID=46172 RepID=UPI0034138AAD